MPKEARKEQGTSLAEKREISLCSVKAGTRKKAKSILLIGRSYPESEENEKLGTNPRLGPEGDERPVQSIKKRENRIPAGVRKRLHPPTIEDWLLAYIKQLRNSLHGLLRYGILDGESTEWTKGWTGYGIGDYRQRDVPIPMRTR